MRKMALILLIGSGFLFGCAHLPIKDVSQDEARALLNDFQGRLGGKYEMLSSVTFKYGFFTFSSLGVTSVDVLTDRLAVAGVTPVGITLFQVVVEQGKTVRSYVIPEFAKRGDVAKAVSGSIRDIYFDLTPVQMESAFSRGEKIYIKAPLQGEERLEYVFSEPQGMLLEKRFYKKGQIFWTVYYNNWLSDDRGQIYPGNIRLLHKAYRYQLLINVKEVKPL